MRQDSVRWRTCYTDIDEHMGMSCLFPFGNSLPLLRCNTCMACVLCGKPALAFQYHGLFLLIPVFLLGVGYRTLCSNCPKRWLDVGLTVCAVCIFIYGLLRWVGVVTMP